jgi:hypothetical protein
MLQFERGRGGDDVPQSVGVWRDGEEIDAELLTKPYSQKHPASAVHRALNG